MVVGSLRVNGWKIKSEVLDKFDLGKGHLNWFKPRLLYLHRRHVEVKFEMSNRGFKHDVLSINEADCPPEFWGDWNPTLEDSKKIRTRLYQKITANKLPLEWWRFNRINLTDQTVASFLERIMNSEMFYV